MVGVGAMVQSPRQALFYRKNTVVASLQPPRPAPLRDRTARLCIFAQRNPASDLVTAPSLPLGSGTIRRRK